LPYYNKIILFSGKLNDLGIKIENPRCRSAAGYLVLHALHLSRFEPGTRHFVNPFGGSYCNALRVAGSLKVEEVAVGVVNAFATAIAGSGNIPDAGHGVDFIVGRPLTFHEDGQLGLWIDEQNWLILAERILHVDSPSFQIG
jgi:hypothetical protein